MTIPLWRPIDRIISSITNANPGVVTTTTNHGYFSGLIIRFFYPVIFGMTELLGNIYTITVLNPNTFAINQNTSNFGVFSLSSTLQSPQVSPVGEVANTLSNAEKNILIPIGG